MEVSGHLHTLATLPQGKSPRNPFSRKLGGSQSQSGHGYEEKKFPSLSLLATEPWSSSL